MAKLLPVLLLAVFLTFVIASFTSKTTKTAGTALPATTEDSVSKVENKKYWMVILRTGTNRKQTAASAASMEDAHMNTMRNLVKEGKLVVAGPFTEKEELQDVFIMECNDSLEVANLIQQDPAVATGWLKAEIRPCWTARNWQFK
jgi:uncharacterized protein YciI